VSWTDKHRAIMSAHASRRHLFGVGVRCTHCGAREAVPDTHNTLCDYGALYARAEAAT
jgi:hypothetical protein